MENNNQKVYSLAMEELALALGLMGESGIANQLLTGGKIKIKPDEMDIRLDSAIHSMLARGLCKIDSQGQAILDEQLQEAIRLITKFEKIISLTLVIRKQKVESNIRIDQKGQFLVQTISPDGIYILDYYKQPLDIQPFFEEIMGTNLILKNNNLARDLPMTVKLLSEIVAQHQFSQVAKILTKAGWDDTAANILASDFQKEKIRGMFVFEKVGNNISPQENALDGKKSIFFLNSIEHLWLFNLPVVDFGEKGTANSVSRQEAAASVSAFLQ